MEVGVHCKSWFFGCHRFWFRGFHVDSLLHVEAKSEAEAKPDRPKSGPGATKTEDVCLN